MKTKEDFDVLIDKLLDGGIEITMARIDGKTIYDLNSGAKSHLWLYYDPVKQEIRYEGRYDDTGFVDDYSDVLSIMKRYYSMRGFASYKWLNLLVKEGRLKEKVEIETNIEFFIGFPS